MTNAELIRELTELKKFAEDHNDDQPRGEIMHGLRFIIPRRLKQIIEELQPKERPFGSISIGAEMAASMGADPRPYLSNEVVAEQLRRPGRTLEEGDAAWDRVCKMAGDYSDVPF
jgi:hypothetical protein